MNITTLFYFPFYILLLIERFLSFPQFNLISKFRPYFNKEYHILLETFLQIYIQNFKHVKSVLINVKKAQISVKDN